MKIINEISLNNEIVLVNIDLNIDQKNKELLNKKINDILPTIKYALNNKAKVVLMSHLNCSNENIKQIAQILCNKLNQNIYLSKFNNGLAIDYALKKINDGQLLMLSPLNEKNHKDSEFVDYWLEKSNIFINENINDINSNDEALTLIQNNFKEICVGFDVNKGIKILEPIINNSFEKPLVVIFGGELNFLKMKSLKSLLKIANKILIAGELAPTFLKANGVDTGNSFIYDRYLNEIKDLLKFNPNKFVLPIDFFCYENNYEINNVKLQQNKINDNFCFLDIGKATSELYSKELKEAKTIIWDGFIATKDEALAGSFYLLETITQLDGVEIISLDQKVNEIINNLKFNYKFSLMLNDNKYLYNSLNDKLNDVIEIIKVE